MGLWGVQEPQEEPNLEQTASLLSFALFTFLNPTISEASSVPHLSASRFPPMCDYDRSTNLIHRSFRVRATPLPLPRSRSDTDGGVG